MARLTLVEDDPAVRAALVRALIDRGHHVEVLASGAGAVTQILHSQPDVVILDLGLPHVDGTEILKRLRAVRQTPVIVASARDADDDVINVLNLGADDFVVKPFSADQLDARIRAVLRRAVPSGEPEDLRIAGLRIDGLARQVWLDDAPLALTPKEFDLLSYLALHRNEVVSKRRLLAEVWKQSHGGTDKTVDVHLSWLRRKIGEAGGDPACLRTVRGVGVQLVDKLA